MLDRYTKLYGTYLVMQTLNQFQIITLHKICNKRLCLSLVRLICVAKNESCIL